MQLRSLPLHYGANVARTRVPVFKVHVRPAPGRLVCRKAGEEPPKETGSGPSSSDASTSPATASTSTATAIPGEDENMQLPKEVIERLKTTVFGFDTFWVTSVENYQGDGVLFKGNVRGKDPSVSYQKMRDRLKNELGERYELFQLTDKEEKPVVVVLPAGRGLDGQISTFTEVWLAALFAVATAVTSFNAAGVPLLEWVIAPGSVPINADDFRDAVPGVLALWFALGAHDFGHYQAAARQGLKLYLPFYIPAGFGLLGSFGSITRVRGFVPNREALLDLSVSGPLYGAVASSGLLLLGFILTAAGVTNVGIDTPAFADSLLIALLAQLFVSDELAQPVMQVNFLLIAGWAGLIANSINCIPAGELDGAKMTLGLWGRKLSGVVSLWTQLVLGFSAIFSGNALSFYWLLLIIFLQRGPILPCREEISEPKTAANRTTALALLGFSLLVLIPFPIELAYAMYTSGGPNYPPSPMDVMPPF